MTLWPLVVHWPLVTLVLWRGMGRSAYMGCCRRRRTDFWKGQQRMDGDAPEHGRGANQPNNLLAGQTPVAANGAVQEVEPGRSVRLAVMTPERQQLKAAICFITNEFEDA